MRGVLDQLGSGSCGPGQFDHDYALPPHNTPENPRPVDEAGREGACHNVSSPDCTRLGYYEVVVYSGGTHEWVALHVCVPCTARLRSTARGPRGAPGIARIRELVPGTDTP